MHPERVWMPNRSLSSMLTKFQCKNRLHFSHASLAHPWCLISTENTAARSPAMSSPSTTTLGCCFSTASVSCRYACSRSRIQFQPSWFYA